jgi:hypothetical protein
MQTDPAPRRRLRFRLLTMILTIAVALLSVSHFYTTIKLRDSTQKVAKLRDELGYIEVEDRTKVHVLALPTTEIDTWRWRLFIPKGARYAWRLASENIPAAGVPIDGTSGISNENYSARDNEVLVTASLHQRPDGSGDLVVTSKIAASRDQMAGASHRIPASDLQWRKTSPGHDGHVLGSNSIAILDPAGPIELLKLRSLEQQPNGDFAPSKKPMPGIAVWLEKQ